MGQNNNWNFLTDFIKSQIGNFEEELAKLPYCVKAKRHPERSNLVMFKYHQFESDFSNPVVRCCRGSVYDIREEAHDYRHASDPAGAKTVKPYLMPFFKFMNYGEPGADAIDWNSTLYIRDKLDGSLLKVMIEEDGNALWTTNGSFDIDVEVPEVFPAENDENLKPPYTFASLRDYALRGRDGLRGQEEEIKRLPKMWTFMFELTSPYNRIVVPYRETKLTLLGCRDPDGLEHTPEWAKKEFGLSFDTPKVFSFNNIEEVLAYCKSITTNDVEGFVIQDAHFNRIKVKTEHYRSLALLKGEDNFNDSRIFDAIRQGSIDDAVAAWPEIGKRAEEIKAEWIGFRNTIKSLCEKGAEYFLVCRNEHPNDPKEAKKKYASFVMGQHQAFSSFLFEGIKPNADIEKIFDKIEYKELRDYWLPLTREMQS